MQAPFPFEASTHGMVAHMHTHSTAIPSGTRPLRARPCRDLRGNPLPSLAAKTSAKGPDSRLSLGRKQLLNSLILWILILIQL